MLQHLHHVHMPKSPAPSPEGKLRRINDGYKHLLSTPPYDGPSKKHYTDINSMMSAISSNTTQQKKTNVLNTPEDRTESTGYQSSSWPSPLSDISLPPKLAPRNERRQDTSLRAIHSRSSSLSTIMSSNSGSTSAGSSLMSRPTISDLTQLKVSLTDLSLGCNTNLSAPADLRRRRSFNNHHISTISSIRNDAESIISEFSTDEIFGLTLPSREATHAAANSVIDDFSQAWKISQSTIHSTSSTSAEFLLQLTAAGRQDTASSPNAAHRAETAARSKRIDSQVAWAVGSSKHPLALDVTAKVRLHSVFFLPPCAGEEINRDYFQHPHRKLWAYLLPQHLVVLRPTSDGFEDLHTIIDLCDDAVSISHEANGLIFTNSDTHESYRLITNSEAILAHWLEAVFNQNYRCPLEVKGNSDANFCGLNSLDMVTSGSATQVLCLPIHLLPKVLPNVLGCLQHQDRLGLIVVTQDGALAYVKPHKPGWSGWKRLLKLRMSMLSEFTPAYSGAIDTALEILRESPVTNTLVSQSVVVVSGCPVGYCDITYTNISIHTVGYGDYDLSELTQLAEQTPNATFQHVESISELSSVLAGLYSSEKTVRFRNVSVDFRIPSAARLVTKSSAPFESSLELTTFRHPSGDTQVNLNIGKLLCGQTQTFLFELEFDDSATHLASLAQDVAVTFTSAVAGRVHIERPVSTSPGLGPYKSNMVPPSFVFGRMSLLVAEVLDQCLELCQSQEWSTLHRFLEDAVQISNDAAQRHGYDHFELANIYEMPFEDVAFGWHKVGLLSKGIAELHMRIMGFSKTEKLNPSGESLLYEARETLRHQCAIRGHTTIHRLFFEGLDSNVI